MTLHLRPMPAGTPAEDLMIAELLNHENQWVSYRQLCGPNCTIQTAISRMAHVRILLNNFGYKVENMRETGYRVSKLEKMK